MLDFLRRSATSVFAWIILGVLAIVFGLSFGLPTDTLYFGTQPLVNVFGERIDDQSYRFQYNLIRRFLPVPKDARFQQMIGFKEEVLEAAIEREVLREAGEQMGLAATTKDAEDLVANGHIIVLGDTYDWLGDLNFDYELFSNAFLRPLQASETSYLEEQRDEWLARTVRDVVESSVMVPEGELRKRYEEEANRLSLRYIRFGFSDYAQLVDPKPADIDGWLEKHKIALQAEYAKQGARFLKLPPQASVSVIQVSPPAAPQEPTADASAPASAAPSVDEVAAAARQRIVAGEDFRVVAREVSAHESGRAGGSLGWITVKAGTGLGAAVDTAVQELGAEGLSDVLADGDDRWIVRVSDTREGDVPESDALRELAEEAIKLAQGRALAEQAATEALGRVRGGDTTGLEVRESGLFAKGEPAPGLGEVPELVDSAWSAKPEDGFLDRVFTSSDAALLADLERKEEGTDEGYLAVRSDLYAEAKRLKSSQVMAAWAGYRCRDGKDRGHITSAPEKIERILTYTGEAEAPAPTQEPYEVCARVGRRGGLLRSSLFGRGG